MQSTHCWMSSAPVVSQRSPLGMTDFAPLASPRGFFFVAEMMRWKSLSSLMGGLSLFAASLASHSALSSRSVLARSASTAALYSTTASEASTFFYTPRGLQLPQDQQDNLACLPRTRSR